MGKGGYQMKQTLYVRIIVVTMGIMLLSGCIAFVATNVYYHFNLKPKNDAKITKVAESLQKQFQGTTFSDLDNFLTGLTDLGYQFQLRSREGKHWHYGDPFRKDELDIQSLQQVFEGKTYHGIKEDPFRFYITGFFKNELSNTIGVPVEVAGDTYALFVRPDTRIQFGEMRSFLAIALGLLLLFSFILILGSTRYIVNPIKKLAKATQKITLGNYHTELSVKRNDEIGRLARDFSKMAKALNEIDQKRAEFVSNVSHEIQSPLTSINGFSQALREEDLPEEIANHYLSIIESESKRLSMLSKQLLTLSFLDHRTDKSEWTIYDLEDQLKEVITSLRWQWQEKDLSVEIETVPVSVYGNPRLLHQVWHNLLTNAIRYTEKDGTIKIKLFVQKQDVIITVSDTGIGIPKKSIPYVFERFYKVDEARVRTENSTGLGLAIVQKIVQLHHGSITVESEIHQGTTFTVTLTKVNNQSQY